MTISHPAFDRGFEHPDHVGNPYPQSSKPWCWFELGRYFAQNQLTYECVRIFRGSIDEPAICKCSNGDEFFIYRQPFRIEPFLPVIPY
jgi:hypothetical protein